MFGKPQILYPFTKLDQKEDVNNYRPISILPTVSKIMEKLIYLKFMKYLNDNKLLHEKQSGFKAGHSSEPKSDTENITCEVPQGSTFGSLLFLIFINDMPLKLQNSVASTDLYADDTTIYDIQYEKKVLENKFQRSLGQLQQWCKENTDKTKVMFNISRQKRCNLNDASLHLNCNNIDLKLTKGDKI